MRFSVLARIYDGFSHLEHFCVITVLICVLMFGAGPEALGIVIFSCAPQARENFDILHHIGSVIGGQIPEPKIPTVDCPPPLFRNDLIRRRGTFSWFSTAFVNLESASIIEKTVVQSILVHNLLSI